MLQQSCRLLQDYCSTHLGLFYFIAYKTTTLEQLKTKHLWQTITYVTDIPSVVELLWSCCCTTRFTTNPRQIEHMEFQHKPVLQDRHIYTRELLSISANLYILFILCEKR